MKLSLCLVAASVLLFGCGDDDEAATSGVPPGFCEPPEISDVELSELKGTEKISCATARAVAREAIECQFGIGDCNRRGLSRASDAYFVLNGRHWDCGFRYDTLEPPPGGMPILQTIECWPMDKSERFGEVTFNVDDYTTILPLGDS